MIFDGQKLRDRRKRAKLTMHQLAKNAGIGPTTVYMLESGNMLTPRMETVSRLADALGVKATSFFAQKNQENDKTMTGSEAAV